MENKDERASWSGQWAFILAAAGSAVGLGSLWRFPYLAARYGGGTFILVFIVLVFTIGIALLLLEITLGRKTGLSAIGAYSSFGKKYKFIGVLSALVPFIITPYYCLIGGWVLKYCAGYALGQGTEMADGGTYFSAFVSGPTESYLWMAVFIAITFLVVAMGVNGGVEKANKVMMPALLVAAVAISVYTALQPGAAGGLAYYFIPDWSKFSPQLVVAALGQVFFSLSLAMGIMITYGSYLSSKENLTSSVRWIAASDVAVSILAGAMIVPGAFIATGSADAVAAHAGPSLMFVTLPELFANMGSAGNVIGFVFFVLVLFAALTSSISLAETLVSILEDGLHWTRRLSLVGVVIYVVVLGFFVNAGYNVLSFIQPLGPGTALLDAFDFVSNSVLMPIVALCSVIFVGWVIKPKVIVEEIEKSSAFKHEKLWIFMIKYIAPILLVIIFAAYVGAQFGLVSF